MLIDIKGKINEKRLSYANTLLPLFEAVVNSIQAIEEGSATATGIIEITLTRSKQGEIDFVNQSTTPVILDFVIKDNGIGFKTMPDNDGFFFFNDNYNLYVEIISFDKLTKDSKQRNKVLFEKLNLPSS